MKRRSPFRIRTLEPADIDALIEIYREPVVTAGTLAMPHTSAVELRARFSEVSPHTRHLVADWGGKVVGHLGLNVCANPRRAHAAWVGMMVSEGFQGRGVGAALLDASIELAEKWCGVFRIELDVFVDNTRAIQLYFSRGFVVEGIARAYALRNGALVDTFRMARVAQALPYPRVSAEDAASRPAPQLPRAKKTRAKGRGNGGGAIN